jgi:adenylyl cyclase-associated protein
MSAVFDELNKGEAITSGLRKVTDDMKSKNRADRSGLVASGDSSGPTVAAKQVAKPVAAKTPKFALDGKKWAVEHQVGNKTIVIDDVNPKQTVYVYDCVDCVIQIKGKANAITLDKCVKTGVVFQDALATCELVNCVSVQVQCTGAVPTVAIDKVDGCQVFLGPQSYGAEVTTAKCSEVNITCVPEAGDESDPVETPVPEQFVTTRDAGSGKWVTVPMGHSGG